MKFYTYNPLKQNFHITLTSNLPNTANTAKSNNNQITFINYSNEEASKGIVKKNKLKSKTTKSITKKPRSSLIKVPANYINLQNQQRIKQPSLLPLISSYDMLLMERYYKYRRLQEFGKISTTILNNRLQPQFSKYRLWLNLGSCLSDLVHTLFISQDCQF